MLIESSTVLEQYVMNIKANLKERKWLDVGHGLLICIYKCIQWSVCVCVFVSVCFYIHSIDSSPSVS